MKLFSSRFADSQITKNRLAQLKDWFSGTAHETSESKHCFKIQMKLQWLNGPFSYEKVEIL